jgi:hypothetical protein
VSEQYEDEDLIEAMQPVVDLLAELEESPCVACGETGDTLPCINCDKLVCGECGSGCRWCQDCADAQGDYDSNQ